MIRIAKFSDLDQVRQIEIESFRVADRYTRHRLYSLITRGRGLFAVTTIYAKVQGYAYLEIRKNSLAARLHVIAVCKQFRNRNLGTGLIEHLCEHALSCGKTSITLEVNQHNRKAIKFYQSLGFVKYKILKGYYDSEFDALKFRKTLSSKV